MDHPPVVRRTALALLVVGLGVGLATGLALTALVPPVRAQLLDLVPKVTAPGVQFTPQVDIPGTTFRAQQPTPIEAETFLGTVIAGVYQYGVWLTITAAVFMTMIGGLLWMLAAGNAGRVDTAKRLISSSLFGMVLAFTSYLILQGINPRLLELKLPNIPKVQEEEVDTICCKDPAVPGSPQTYHEEIDISPKASSTTKCKDGNDAVAAPELAACNTACCVCVVAGESLADAAAKVFTGVNALCYGGKGLTQEWCTSRVGKPELSSPGVKSADCALYRGDCSQVAKAIRAKDDITALTSSWYSPWAGQVPVLLNAIRDSFECSRTFTRTQ